MNSVVASSIALGVDQFDVTIVQAYRLTHDPLNRYGYGTCFFLCPWCGGVHIHGYLDGWRASHCNHTDAPQRYSLACAETAPEAVRKELHLTGTAHQVHC